MKLLSILFNTHTHKGFATAAAPLAVLALMAGCAAGPSYQPPRTEVPPAFANGSQTNLGNGGTEIQWWKGFKDSKLDELVATSLTNNHDLRIATANLRQARALRQQRLADFGPSVNGDGAYTKSTASKAADFGFPRDVRELQLFDAGFDATWELDLFGRVRRSLEAGTADLQAAAATRRDVRVSLVSEVARNYFELRGTQHELAVARRNAQNQRETLDITLARLEAGRGTDLDVSRARAQLNNTLAIIPPMEASVSRAMHRLGVLTGRLPTALVSELQTPVPLPGMPQLVAIGSPADLLRRRPDIRVAERNLAAATARIGVQTADLFPRVTFNGRLGLEASHLSGLTKSGSDTYAFGPQITWEALDIWHVRARIKAAGAQADAALAMYEKTALTALEETENALVDFGREESRRQFLLESVKASDNAAKLARQLYENGATDFLAVLDAERTALEAQDQLAQSETRTATYLVAVYKALGGGWENEPAKARPGNK